MMIRSILTTASVILSTSMFAQTAGSLDPTFGTGGKVLTPISGGDAKAYGISIQTDGKIVISGYSTDGTTGKNFATLRYNSDGSLDTSFGNNGMAINDLQTGSDDVAYSVAIQSDGKIVVGGSSDNGFDKNAAIIRYKTDGTVDSTFGINGIVLTDFDNNQQDEIKVVRIHAVTGNIIVGGSSVISSSLAKPVIARYLSNGTIDSTFNSTGIRLLWIATNDNNRSFSLEDLEVVSTGKISATGWRKNVSTSISSEYWACRVLSNGAMDNTFSTDGVLAYADAGGSSYGHALLLNSNQDLILAGTRSYLGDNTYRFLKINQDGTIPATSTFFNITSGIDIAYAIEEDVNGKYVMAGSTGTSTSRAFTILRMSNTAVLDNTFNGSGIVNTVFGSNQMNECFDVAIQTDNKIVAIGYSGTDIALARYLGNDIATSITENNTSSIAVYPNPVNDALMIEMSHTDINSSYQIIDVTGKVWMQGSIKNKFTSIEVKNLPNGIYFLRTGKQTQKIVKM
ncbi:MAG: T9SS type A sorting domain-containing protein [Bacteroidia bacterium]|nr:T9SS type A sorting domain-containing protein [Bacteroidia bacterium]